MIYRLWLMRQPGEKHQDNAPAIAVIMPKGAMAKMTLSIQLID